MIRFFLLNILIIDHCICYHFFSVIFCFYGAISLYGLTSSAHATGGMIQFRSGELTHIKSSAPLRMLITNTKVGRNTKALVAGVSERASRHPDAMASVFAAVDFISKELSAIIQSPAQDDISITAREEKIEELMEMNQGLLQCMGVSHAAIETVLRTMLKYKLASKLTGAGGGGCVLTLLPTCMLLVLCHLIKYLSSLLNLYGEIHFRFIFEFTFDF